MDVRVRKEINYIMEKMHQVSWWMMELEKAEIEGNHISRKSVGNSKTLNALFGNIQLHYRKLEELLVNNAEIANEMVYGLYEDEVEEENEETKDFNMIPFKRKIDSFIREEFVNEDEANSINSAILEISDYVRGSYASMKYIMQVDETGQIVQNSIYEGTPFEELIAAEAYLQIANLSILEKRIKSKRDPDMYTFYDKANILYHMSLEEFNKKHAIKTISANIDYVKRCKDQYDEKQYIDIISKLYEQKYIYYLTDMDFRYNGIIQENDTGKFKKAKQCIENGSIGNLLCLSEFEINENIKSNMVDLRRELKYEISDIIARANFEEKIRKELKKNKRKVTKNEEPKEESIRDEI